WGIAAKLSEGEDVSAGPGIEEFDLEDPIAHRSGLANELIEARLSDRAGAVGAHVQAVIGSRRGAVDGDAEANRMARRGGGEGEMQIACMEAIGDPPARLIENDRLCGRGPGARERPAIEAEAAGKLIGARRVVNGIAEQRIVGAIVTKIT